MSTDKAPALPKAMGKVAGEEAFRYSIDFDENSKLAKHLSRRKKRPVTELRWSDLEIGKLLGEGNFSHVYEVRLIFRDDLPDTGTVTTGSETISDDVWNSRSDAWKNPNVEEEADIWDLVSSPDAIDSDSYYSDEEKDKTTYQDRCISESKVRERVYALKHLHPDVTRRQQKFTASAIDLVLEAKILSCLDHPNIVKLFGVTEGSINKAFTDHGYFLLLDRLNLTLEDKIKEWTSMEAMAAITLSIASASERRALMQRRKFAVSKSKRRFETPPTSSETSLSSKDRSAMLKEKIGNVAISIARGMEYLHSHQIIFRDLKPSNVGFTKSNRVKIFDFGLAREIVDDSRKLTGNTGSLRYMAPEVNRCDHYGLSADVYSYGIMLWEICVCHKPFHGMSVQQHSELVVAHGYRPKIGSVPGSDNLKNLIQNCWSGTPEQRPSFTDIRLELASEIAEHRRLEELEEINRQNETRKPGMLRMRMLRQREPSNKNLMSSK